MSTTNQDTITVSGKTVNLNSFKEIVSLSKFDWKQQGKTTSVKNQAGTSLCWSFSTVATVEHNLLKKGFIKQPNSIDLDEKSFAFHARNRDNLADPLGNTANDIRDYESALKSWSSGYWARPAAYSLLQWNSLQAQDTHFSYYNFKFPFKAKNIIDLDHKDKNAIKEAVAQHGAVAMSYFEWPDRQTEYYNNPLGFSLNKPGVSGHVATIVGWDDDIEVDKFEYKPSSKGAWLVKNSWGSSWANEGYFWLSYESMLSSAISVEMGKEEDYDFNYYYDGLFEDSNIVLQQDKKAAVLFRAQKGGRDKVEMLKAVNVGVKRAKGEKLRIKIYKDLNYDFSTISFKESNSAAVYDKVHEITHNGLVSFDLEGDGVELEKNKSFLVEVEIQGQKGEITFSNEPNSTNDFSYYYENNVWKNSLADYGIVARIKAWTKIKGKQEAKETSVDVKDIRNADVIFDKNTYRYGETIGSPTIKYEGTTLVVNQDYTLEYKSKFNNNKRYHSDNAMLDGNGLIIVKGINKYNNQLEIPYLNQIALRPNLEKFNVKLDAFGNVIEFNNSSLNQDWVIDSSTNYLSYIGSDKNNYRNTMFSIKTSSVPNLNVAHVTPSYTQQIQPPELSQPATVNTQVEDFKQVEVSNPVQDVNNVSPTITPELTTMTSSIPRATVDNTWTLTTSLGGAGFLGLFSLIPLLFKKLH